MKSILLLRYFYINCAYFVMPRKIPNDKSITIADLYPGLSPEHQAEAEFYLLGYLDVVRRIFERISQENPELLTELEKTANLKGK